MLGLVALSMLLVGRIGRNAAKLPHSESPVGNPAHSGYVFLGWREKELSSGVEPED